MNLCYYFFQLVPICMPPDVSEFTGRMATVTGWGRLRYAGGVPSVLQEVQVSFLLCKCHHISYIIVLVTLYCD